jgi:hypothetical protein
VLAPFGSPGEKQQIPGHARDLLPFKDLIAGTPASIPIIA